MFGTDASGDVKAFATDDGDAAHSMRDQMEVGLANVTFVDTAELTASPNLVHRTRRPSEDDE